MKLINKQISIDVIIFISILLSNCIGRAAHGETWIETNDIFNVELDMTTAELIQQLGEPLFVESFKEIDDEEITTLYCYNFRTKEYGLEILEQNKGAIENAENYWGRTTKIQFTFINDRLISWEEDRLTLSLAITEKPKRLTTLQYLSLLVNLILIIKVF